MALFLLVEVCNLNSPSHPEIFRTRNLTCQNKTTFPSGQQLASSLRPHVPVGANQALGYCHTPLQHSSLKFSDRDSKVTRHFSSQHVTTVNIFSFFFVNKVCKWGHTRNGNSAVCRANLLSGRTWHVLVDFFLYRSLFYIRTLSPFLSRSFPCICTRIN